MATARAMTLSKLEVVNIITTSISSTSLTSISVGARCVYPEIIFRGLINL